VRRISLKAILIGGVVDIVATNLASLPLLVGVFASHSLASLPPDQQVAALTAALVDSPSLYTTGLLIGAACSLLGGWVAANIVRRDETIHGALSAFACIALGLYGWSEASAYVGAWEHLAFFVLSPALGAFGGVLRARMGYGPREPSARQGLRGWSRALYVTDLALLTVSVLLVALFAMVALYSRGTGERQAFMGSIVLATFGALVALLYLLAGRALVAGRSRHWAFHAAAVGLTVLPVLLLI